MGTFTEEFLSRFDVDGQESEAAKLLSIIGANSEKSIFEGLDAEIRQAQEFLAFSDVRLRSWLAYFYTHIRMSIAATGYGKIQQLDNGANGFTVQAGSLLQGANGKLYSLISQLPVAKNGSSNFVFRQGQGAVWTGQYNQYIAIPAQGLDLSYLRVVRGTIPSGVNPYDSRTFFTSEVPKIEGLQQLMGYGGNSGNMKSEIAVINNETITSLTTYLATTTLTVAEQTAIITRIQSAFTEDSMVVDKYSLDYFGKTPPVLVPVNGYFAFYYGGVLYIKIYRGVEGDNAVLDPEGATYSVIYWVSDGLLGNLGANKLSRFLGSVKDNAGTVVSYVLSNDEVTNGRGEPEHYELVNMLRASFFAQRSLASVPELVTWLSAQPEVGDCYVLSDYERARRVDTIVNNPTATYNITGRVDIYIMASEADSEGSRQVVLLESPAYIYATGVNSSAVAEGYITSGLLSLENRFLKVRDIMTIVYHRYIEVPFFFKVSYRASLNDTEFEAKVSSIFQNYFDMIFAKNSGNSLFEDLDLSLLYDEILDTSYAPEGFLMKGYHFCSHLVTQAEVGTDIVVGVGPAGAPSTYQDEIPGGYYEVWRKGKVASGFSMVIDDEDYHLVVGVGDAGSFDKQETFYEVMNSDEYTGTIYVRDKNTQVITQVGTRARDASSAVSTVILEAKLSGEGYLEGGLRAGDYIFCYWLLEDQGMAMLGQEDGARFLRGMSGGVTLSAGAVQFEKYI
jgi:hypothetical protein